MPHWPEMLPPFHQIQEDPPKSNCLGIFGLSLYTTERDLKDFLEKYGSVDSCQLVYDHQVREPCNV